MQSGWTLEKDGTPNWKEGATCADCYNRATDYAKDGWGFCPMIGEWMADEDDASECGDFFGMEKVTTRW